MNISFLTLILLAETGGIFLVSKFDFTSVTLWIAGMFSFSAFVYMLNSAYFVSDITWRTIVVVEATIIFYWFGEYMGNRTRQNIKKIRYKRSYCFLEKNKPYIVSDNFVLIIGLFILFISVCRFWEMYTFTKGIGNDSIWRTVYYIRPYMTAEEYKVSTWISFLSNIAEASAYVFSFYFFYNFFTFRIIKCKLLIPVVMYMIFLITTTGRTGFIKLFIIILTIIYVMLYKNSGNRQQLNKKIVKYSIIIVAMIVVVFYLYGRLVRKSDHTLAYYSRDYFSAGLYGLNDYLKHPWEKNTHFGEYTLSNYYYYINKFLNCNFFIPGLHLRFFFWENGSSNIYTGFTLPIQDFGVIGMLFTRSIMAYIYTIIKKYVLKSKNITSHVTFTILLGYFVYVNFSISIADRFKEVLTIISFPALVIFILIINILYQRNARRYINLNLVYSKNEAIVGYE